MKPDQQKKMKTVTEELLLTLTMVTFLMPHKPHAERVGNMMSVTHVKAQCCCSLSGALAGVRHSELFQKSC